MKHGIVNRSTDGIFDYQGWPTVSKDENGIIRVVCSGHRLGHVCPFGKNLMYESFDGGKTWGQPIIINDTILDDRDAALLHLGNKKMLFSWFNHPMDYYFDREDTYLKRKIPTDKIDIAKGMLNYWRKIPEKNEYGSFVKLSDDNGKNWGKKIKIPAFAPHGPILLSNGKLFLLGRKFTEKTYAQNTILALESEDNGESWRVLSEIPVPKEIPAAVLCEPHVVEVGENELLGIIRAQGEGISCTFTMYSSKSIDGGKTWSIPQCLNICGAPPHLIKHSSGKIILTYGRRDEPYGIFGKISNDNGNTFGKEFCIYNTKSRDIGYPSSVELKNGNILTVYYSAFNEDDFCSVLYTEWKIDEVEKTIYEK